MKILVCGGRKFDNYYLLENVLDKRVLSTDTIIHGGAYGADGATQQYCNYNEIETKIYRPNYELFGRVAPLYRNKIMVRECDEVIAFWDGKSRGTGHTIRYANEEGKNVTIINY